MGPYRPLALVLARWVTYFRGRVAMTLQRAQAQTVISRAGRGIRALGRGGAAPRMSEVDLITAVGSIQLNWREITMQWDNVNEGALLEAIEAQDRNRVQELLGVGVCQDWDIADNYGPEMGSLLLASSIGFPRNEAAATAFVERHREEINTTDRHRNWCLGRAARHGHLHFVSALLTFGAQINCRNAGGHTPLMEAAYRGHPDVVSALLQEQAPIEDRNNRGETALDLAVNYNCAATFRVLLENNAPINYSGETKTTVLRRLLDKFRHDLEVANALTERLRRAANEEAFNVPRLREAASNFLVVATLIVTTSYSAYLNPPQGWDDGFVRPGLLLFVYANNISFFSAVGVIFLCIIVVVPGTTVPGADTVRRQVLTIVTLVFLSTISGVVAFVAAAVATSKRKDSKILVVPGILTFMIVAAGFIVPTTCRDWWRKLCCQRGAPQPPTP